MSEGRLCIMWVKPISDHINHSFKPLFHFRPGKVDSLFPISHFLNFDPGVHYSHNIFNLTMYIKIFFYIEKLQTQIQEITNQLQMLHLMQIQVI